MLFTTEFEIQKDVVKAAKAAKIDLILAEKAGYMEGAAFNIAKAIEFKEIDGYGDIVHRFRHRVHIFKDETVELFKTSLLTLLEDPRYTNFQRKEMGKDLLRQFLNTL